MNMKTATGFGKNRPNSPLLIQEDMRNGFVQAISSQKVNYGQYLTAGHHSRKIFISFLAYCQEKRLPKKRRLDQPRLDRRHGVPLSIREPLSTI